MKRGAVIVVLGLLAASPAFASMRCGTKIINEGVTPLRGGRQVRRTRRSDHAAQRVPQTGHLVQRPALLHRRELHRSADRSWVYNLGPNKLMRRVVFEAGFVTEIETLGYGYNK